LPFCHARIKAKKPKDPAYPAKIETLGDQMKAKRIELGLHQKDVAAMLGVSTDTICYWENNRVKPSRLLLCRVTRFLKIRKRKFAALFEAASRFQISPQQKPLSWKPSSTNMQRGERSRRLL